MKHGNHTTDELGNDVNRLLDEDLFSKPQQMEEKTNLDKIPSGIVYYLLEWKDRNMDEYLSKYGDLRLRDLLPDQIQGLFYYATTKDSDLLRQFSTNK